MDGKGGKKEKKVTQATDIAEFDGEPEVEVNDGSDDVVVLNRKGRRNQMLQEDPIMETIKMDECGSNEDNGIEEQEEYDEDCNSSTSSEEENAPPSNSSPTLTRVEPVASTSTSVKSPVKSRLAFLSRNRSPCPYWTPKISIEFKRSGVKFGTTQEENENDFEDEDEESSGDDMELEKRKELLVGSIVKYAERRRSHVDDDSSDGECDLKNCGTEESPNMKETTPQSFEKLDEAPTSSKCVRFTLPAKSPKRKADENDGDEDNYFKLVPFRKRAKFQLPFLKSNVSNVKGNVIPTGAEKEKNAKQTKKRK